MKDKITFAFSWDGYIQNISFPFLTLYQLIYLIAATVIHTVEQSNRYGFKDIDPFEDDDNFYNMHSDIEHPLYDRVIDRYTNWSEGCSLNNSLQACGKFLHDLSEQVVKNGKFTGDLWHLLRDCSYIGAPIKGVVDKRGVEIITDALDRLQEYCEKIAEAQGKKYSFQWNEYNEELLKLFKV